MPKLDWMTRQHLAAFGLWVWLLALTQAAPSGAFGFGAWADGLYRVVVEGFPLSLIAIRLEHHWEDFLWLGGAYLFFNGTYFMGIKDRITLISQGEDRPPLIMLPFLHPYGPDGMKVADLTGYRYGFNSSPWLRFYFVTLGFFFAAFVFSLIVAVYSAASGFPYDLFSAWVLAFKNWHSVWLEAVSGSSMLTGIVLAYFYWRHVAPRIVELFIRSPGVLGNFLRKHCLTECTGPVQELVETKEDMSNFTRILAFSPRMQFLPFNKWHDWHH